MIADAIGLCIGDLEWRLKIWIWLAVEFVMSIEDKEGLILKLKMKISGVKWIWNGMATEIAG